MAAVRALALPLALVALAIAPAIGVASGTVARGTVARAHSTTSPVARARSAPLLGVNVTNIGTDATSDADRDIATAAAMHATVVRAEVDWSVMQPSGPASSDLRALAFADRLVADASARHIRVILLVDSAPCWASSAPPSVLRHCTMRGSRANGYGPKNPADFAAFVAFLAQRYGSALAAIEIWNEPDHINERYFAGPEKARRYAELVKLAYPAIKRANPAVAVIAGSLVGSNGVFLQALYANGIKGYYDGLAVHYYTLTLASVRAIRRVQLANGDSTPLWLDEFGWPSCWPRERIQAEQPCVTESVEAANLRDVFRALARSGYVAAELSYNMRDTPSEDFGVVSRIGVHKRSFGAVTSAFASPFGPVSRTKLKLHARAGVVYATGSGPAGDIMQLEASARSGLRYRATFTLDRFDRFSLALPRALGRHGIRVRVWQVWAGRAAGAAARI